MAPELLNSLDAAELRDVTQRIREYQEVHKLSDSAMLRRFAAMGSTTTYQKILKGKLEELNLEAQLTNYRSVIALIEAIREDVDDEEIYSDFVGTLELKRAFMETDSTKSIARFILVQGDTGMGKTFCKKALLKQFNMRMYLVEATVAMGDRPRALLCAFLTALGINEHPLAEYDCLLAVIKKLKEGKRAGMIDEAHHLGPRCLNTIKTIINETPGEIIAFAMKTLWGRLERAAYEECRQLTGNRLAERIRLELHESDVERFVSARLKMAKGDITKAVEQCMKHAPLRGNHGFIREVCKRARIQADGEAVTFEIFVNALTAEVRRR